MKGVEGWTREFVCIMSNKDSFEVSNQESKIIISVLRRITLLPVQIYNGWRLRRRPSQKARPSCYKEWKSQMNECACKTFAIIRGAQEIKEKKILPQLHQSWKLKTMGRMKVWGRRKMTGSNLLPFKAKQNNQTPRTCYQQPCSPSAMHLSYKLSFLSFYNWICLSFLAACKNY